MKRGLVVGEVWATRMAPGLESRPLKLVVEYPGSGAAFELKELGLAPLVVAVDTLDARRGQEVLVAYGSGARNVLRPGPDNRHELCDAAVAMLVEDSVAKVLKQGPEREPGQALAQFPANSPGSHGQAGSSLAKRGA